MDRSIDRVCSSQIQIISGHTLEVNDMQQGRMGMGRKRGSQHPPASRATEAFASKRREREGEKSKANKVIPPLRRKMEKRDREEERGAENKVMRQ